MDYLELDDAATQAFEELGGDIDVQHVSSRRYISPSTTPRTHPHRRRRVEATYLLRLENPFPTPRHVANALGLSRVPQLEHGTAENGEAHFCRLYQSSINALDAWTATHYPNQTFTKIRIGLAHKDLGVELPLLGRDPTLPHHRPCFSDSLIAIKHHVCEYPVLYFFYGTLADPARLARLFGVCASELQILRPAVLLDGRIRTWAGKYRALIDEPGTMVNGFVYACTSVDQEDALRVYEGDAYEVVAARLIVDGEEIMGRTFRFAGFEDELTD
jgi:hypothetical protein